MFSKNAHLTPSPFKVGNCHALNKKRTKGKLLVLNQTDENRIKISGQMLMCVIRALRLSAVFYIQIKYGTGTEHSNLCFISGIFNTKILDFVCACAIQKSGTVQIKGFKWVSVRMCTD